MRIQRPCPLLVSVTAVSALLVCVFVVALGAQSFAVVSIKPSGNEPLAPGYGRGLGFQPGGRYVQIRMQPLSLILDAFREDPSRNLRLDQIDRSSVPSWVSSARYDIEARMKNGPAEIDAATRTALLKSVLVERFKIKAHFEQREQAIYSLVLANRDGSLGTNLRPNADYDCDALTAAFEAGLRGGDPRPLPTAANGGQACAMSGGPGTLRGRSVPIGMLAGMLGPNVGGRRVVDHTNLSGRYDIDLQWTRDAATTGADTPTSIAEWPPLFTALQDQLGLKLQDAHETVNVLVVDHIEQPTPD